MPPRKPSLTPKMRAFVREFCVYKNGAKAAREAGYSEATAKVIAYQLLHRPDIQAAIREREDGDERLIGSRRHSVLERLNDVANRAMQAELVRAAEKGKPGVYRFDGATAVRALELLGKHEGMFREAIDLRVQGEVEKLLDGVRALMPPHSYADLVRALAEITGITGVDPQAASGDRGEAVH